MKVDEPHTGPSTIDTTIGCAHRNMRDARESPNRTAATVSGLAPSPGSSRAAVATHAVASVT